MNNQSTENVGADERFELADLRRQVLFLQAQLEERERTVQQLRQQVADVTTSSSAPTSICDSTTEMCNAATQTDRVIIFCIICARIPGHQMLNLQAV